MRNKNKKPAIVVQCGRYWRLYNFLGYCIAERCTELDAIELANQLGLSLLNHTQPEAVKILNRLPKYEQTEA
jgi:hypothetical protein